MNANSNKMESDLKGLLVPPGLSLFLPFAFRKTSIFQIFGLGCHYIKFLKLPTMFIALFCFSCTILQPRQGIETDYYRPMLTPDGNHILAVKMKEFFLDKSSMIVGEGNKTIDSSKWSLVDFSTRGDMLYDTTMAQEHKELAVTGPNGIISISDTLASIRAYDDSIGGIYNFKAKQFYKQTNYFGTLFNGEQIIRYKWIAGNAGDGQQISTCDLFDTVCSKTIALPMELSTVSPVMDSSGSFISFLSGDSLLELNINTGAFKTFFMPNGYEVFSFGNPSRRSATVQKDCNSLHDWQ
jgi:hypothetical protein